MPGGDIHICGTCLNQFTDIQQFIDHKTNGCPSNSGGANCASGQGQMGPPQIQRTSNNPGQMAVIQLPNIDDELGVDPSTAVECSLGTVDTSSPSSHGGSSQTQGNANVNMHTEEEDVATFLATQLANQATHEQTSNAKDLTPDTDSDMQYTSISTPQPNRTETQPQTMDSQANKNDGQSGSKPATAVTWDPQELMQMVENRCKEKKCITKGCNFVTTHSKDMERHMRKHSGKPSGEKPFKCEVCGSCFARSDKLKVHSRIHTKEKPYACKEPGCNYRCIDSGSLKKHTRIHTDERPYKCQICPYSARDGSQLTVHLRTHTGDAPFQCMQENCSAAFKTSSDLRRHQRLHLGIKPYKCEKCDYSCAIKSNLNVHIKLNHYEGAKFNCSLCEFQANSRKQLRAHEKTHSSILLPCDYCDHVSTSNHGLRSHLLIHSDDKPFQCRYCAYTCRTTANLRYHMRSKHRNDAPNSKKGGDKTKGQNVSNNTSKRGRRSQSSKPACYASFKCEECGSGFVREDSWRAHVRLHENQKQISEAIPGPNKLDPDIFSAVIQDAVLHANAMNQVSKEEPDKTYPAVQPMETSSLPTTESTTPSTQQEGNDSGYNSYVIAIDGLSTVFPNSEDKPVEHREAMPNTAGSSQEQYGLVNTKVSPSTADQMAQIKAEESQRLYNQGAHHSHHHQYHNHMGKDMNSTITTTE